MYIESVQITPNPMALKFILSEPLLTVETRQFSDKAETIKDPFAAGIFDIDGVVSVFYTRQFVTIEKRVTAEWESITRQFKVLVEALDRSMIPPEDKAAVEAVRVSNDEKLDRIKRLLDEQIKPYLEADGGGLEVLGLDGQVLKIRYQGACGTCPSAIMGTLQSIEHMVKAEIDPAIEVIPG